MNELTLAKQAADWPRLKVLVLDSVSSPINASGRLTDLSADPADRSAVFLDSRTPDARDPEQIVRRGGRLPAAAAKA
jgi:hypothetical protein